MSMSPTNMEPPADRVIWHHLRHLLLDYDNPRFGSHIGVNNQNHILDTIVDKFGVNDVLSSIAVNGYFAAEPLVCKRVPNSDDAIVIEGNRRLAACLIILGESRAANHTKRTTEYSRLWREHGQKAFDPLPVIMFDADDLQKDKTLLSYLGVRHIASSQPWDSYAKAAWVARVVEANELDIVAVSTMIGDQHRTVNRLLEGYYLVEQLTHTGKFNQQNSVRRGRGSVTDYPFSWVYTVLGYTSVRDFLRFPDGEAHRDPLEDGLLDRGALLLRAMFGDKSKGRNAAIGDSRQLGDFAAIFSNRDKVRLLEQGKQLDDIEEVTQPIEERLSRAFGKVLDTLRDLIARLSEQDVPAPVALDVLEESRRVRKIAIELDRRITEIALGDATDRD